MNRELQVIAFSDSVRGQPFKWGETDCICLGLRLLDILLNDQISAKFTGAWTTEEEASNYYAKELPSDVLAALGLNIVETPQVGDIALCATPQWPECCHIFLGRHVLTSTPEHGVVVVRCRLPADAVMWRA